MDGRQSEGRVSLVLRQAGQSEDIRLYGMGHRIGVVSSIEDEN
jgi:hypothetical protein